MKDLLFFIFGGLATVAIFALWGSTLVPIGYGLYLWGGVGLTFAVSAWSAFKLFLVMLFGGLLVLGISSLGMKATE